VTKVEVEIERPLVLLKDRPSSAAAFEIDLGQITISNETYQSKGRWKSIPDKQMLVTNYRIEAKDVFIAHAPQGTQVGLPLSVTIDFEQPNESSLLTRGVLSPSIDPEEVDLSWHIKIGTTPVQFYLDRQAIHHFWRCIDLNLDYQDMLGEEMQFSVWNSSTDRNEFRIEQDAMEELKGRPVAKMDIQVEMPRITVGLAGDDGREVC